MNSDVAPVGAVPRAHRWFGRICWILTGLGLVLGAVHVLYPDYSWGQNDARHSPFRFDHSLSAASWLASMQLFAAAILAGVAFSRDRRDRLHGAALWLLGIPLFAALSMAEMTRIHERFDYFQIDIGDPFLFSVEVGTAIVGLSLLGWLVIDRVRSSAVARRWAVAWIVAWGGAFLMPVMANFFSPIGGMDLTWFHLWVGLGWLLGCTFLLSAVGSWVTRPALEGTATTVEPAAAPALRLRPAVFLGVAGMTFTILFLQVLLLRVLNIFGDYLTAHSVISIALLGISIGGLLGYQAAARSPIAGLIGASLLLPASVASTYGVVVVFGAESLVTWVVLTVPFALASTVITVALALGKSHQVYFVDLVGAALGAALVGPALTAFREEASLFFLTAFAFLVAGGFALVHPSKRGRAFLVVVCLGGLALAAWMGASNLKHDWLNLIREHVRERYSRAEILFSRSSFVGRYDVVRRSPEHSSLSGYENGRITDTIRKYDTSRYLIDPRLPHNLMEDPSILILGLSGDAITKTAKRNCKIVHGVEINPAVAHLQANDLRPYNANSYDGIDVHVMDGRSFVAQARRDYDMITLMNAHSMRGRTKGRAPSTEYLHTREAMEAYLDVMTDRGVVNIEEPVSRPRREVAVWKLLWTMRQTLLARGSAKPEDHFYVFQWRTRRNNYIQILMKKTPFETEELARLHVWLDECDRRKEIEKERGMRLGPISTVTTLLHSPDRPSESLCSRVVRGEIGETFRAMFGIRETTDDRPFHFDVDPARPGMRVAYTRTLVLALLLLPFFGYFLARYRREATLGVPYLLVVTLTGMAYFLVEVVLIQRYAIFLGSPVVTFTAVLGTLLLFSGLGSLWCGRLQDRGASRAVIVLLGVLAAHALALPALLPSAMGLSLAGRIVIAVLTVAPLAFLMGVPFPYVMRQGQAHFGGPAAAMLFAANGLASALAVPLAFNMSTAWGFAGVLVVALGLYVLVALLVSGRKRGVLVGMATIASVLMMVGLLVSPWLLIRHVEVAPDENRVYAVRYGESQFREDRMFADGEANVYHRFDWQFWVVRAGDRVILVDTGFDDPELAKRWGITDRARPVDRLASIGIQPEDVTDVVLTHLHWDHAGGLSDYPRAQVYLQQAEFDHAERRLAGGRRAAGGMYLEHFSAVKEAQEQGRLHLISGEHELARGVRMIEGGAHTPGSQFVIVETVFGNVILAGDTCYSHLNNVQHRPTGSNVDEAANLATIRKMHALAASPFLIVPGHERLVIRWFPEVADEVVQISPLSPY